MNKKMLISYFVLAIITGAVSMPFHVNFGYIFMLSSLVLIIINIVIGYNSSESETKNLFKSLINTSLCSVVLISIGLLYYFTEFNALLFIMIPNYIFIVLIGEISFFRYLDNKLCTLILIIVTSFVPMICASIGIKIKRMKRHDDSLSA